LAPGAWELRPSKNFSAILTLSCSDIPSILSGIDLMIDLAAVMRDELAGYRY
jgi:hypothetical protein